MSVTLSNASKNVRAEFDLPGDKSIAHRSLLIGALGKGKYTVKNFPNSLDCMATLQCMKNLDVKISIKDKDLLVDSPGYIGFKKDNVSLDCKNSGTTARLISGIAAGAGINAVIIGDKSLSARPMNRIIVPLDLMGSDIESSGVLPIKFNALHSLKGIDYVMPVASAQVKSSILIAGFLSEGKTIIHEILPTRNHSENMFKYLGANIKIEKNKIEISNSDINTKDIIVPGDISSAAFLIACGILGEEYEIVVKNVLLNERRREYLNILRTMGAKLEFSIEGKFNEEEVGYIIVKSSNLKGININKEIIPNIIDEIPMISVLASFADGITTIEGVNELKYKESNRINSIVTNLQKCGIRAYYEGDKLTIEGSNCFIKKDVQIETFGDHRIALAFAALAVRNKGNTTIDNWECTNISFPNSINYFKEFLTISTNL